MRRKNELKASFLVLGFLLAAGAARAQDGTFTLSGSVKTYLDTVGRPPLGGSTGGWLWDNPLRLRLLGRPDAFLTLEAAWELSSEYHTGDSGSVAIFLPPVSSYRLADFKNPLAGSKTNDGESLIQNLDRLSATLHWEKLDIILGRQVVSFGSARSVNPTDVLAPFNLQTLDQENRSGVDACRLRYALGEFGELDGGYVAGRDARWNESSAFLRPKFRLADTDVSLLGMEFKGNALAGFDLQRSLGGAGGWAEGAWVRPGSGDGESYGRLTTGVDYYFFGNLDAALEYHFNGAGRENPSDYLDLRPTAYGAGTVYLLGRHYLAPALSYEATALWTLQGRALVNLSDGSCWFLVQSEYNALKNLYADLGAALPLGPGPRASVPTSEFGLYPSFQFAALRFYF